VSVLAPIAASSAFVAVFVVYYFALGFKPTVPPEPTLVLWGSSLVLLSSATVASLASSWIVLRRHRGDPWTRWALGATVSIAAIAFVVALLVLVVDFTPEDASSGTNADVITTTNGLFALLAVVLILVACTRILDNLATCETARLGARLESYRICLACTSILFVTGVFEIWAMFMHRLGTESKATPSLTIGAGLVFSALLLSVFGPMTAMLHRRFETLASESAQEARRKAGGFSLEAWSLESQLGPSPLHFFGNNVAIVAPVLSSVAVALLGRLLDLKP